MRPGPPNDRWQGWRRGVFVVLLPALAGLVGGRVAAAAAPAPTAGAPAKGASSPPAAGGKLRDRVLAVVDEDPILESDLRRAIGLGLARPNPGESDDAFRRRTLNELVAERLRFHEIERFGFEQVPVQEIEKQVAGIRSGFKDDAGFAARLKELGLDLASLRQLVARQLEVLTYVDERLGPQVFIGLDEIADYYKNVLTPEMARQHLAPPPLEEVREKIREVLRQQRLTQELDRWTEELRRKADIHLYIDRPEGGPLPPVVKRYDRTPPGQEKSKRAKPVLSGPPPP
jgi:peptidyl-prolyl cis-trans isomerase SurA